MTDQQALREATPPDPWATCPRVVHLTNGEELRPDPQTYVVWKNGDGSIHSLRWVTGKDLEVQNGQPVTVDVWRIVPGSQIVYVDLVPPRG